MEQVQPIIDWFQINWPAIVATLTAVSAALGAVYIVYNKAKTMLAPVLEWIKGKKEDTVQNVVNDITMLDMETRITDLKAKINNPTVDPALREQYIKQLATAETLYAKIMSGLATVEEKTNTSSW